ncbi:MAG: AarF/UbiB family protein [Planctomycetaceae bacterium]|nr:AarF/UbiB family protein [Planctomycetaceae bacterium]
MNIWDMRRTYLNIRRLQQILTVLVKHGFSHFLERMRIADYLPWVGRHIENSKSAVRNQEMDIPHRLAAAFEELGPVYVKLGQILAVRPDLIPREFQLAFAHLQDQVPPVSGDQIRPVVEKSLGRPLDEIFQFFSPEAIAAGSIGQVHTAVLKDGSDVIVKIKRPDIEGRIEEDTNLLDTLAELVERHIPELKVVRPKMMAGELRRTLSNELDFVGEAAYATKFRESIADDSGVNVPQIYWQYVTRDVLVMERVEGKALNDIGFLPAAEKTRVANVVADCFMRQYFETGIFHGDPHPGNLLYGPDGVVSIIDFGQTGHISEEIRRTLAQILIALKDNDTDRIVELYGDIGEFAPDANIQGFRFDLANFIDRNYGMPADRIDFSLIAQESLNTARRNGLYLPRDFVLLLKSLMLVASLVQELAPGFRLDVAIIPAVRRLSLSLYRPDVMAGRSLKLLSRFSSLVRRMPDDIRDLLDKARAGRFTINFHHDNLQGVAERTGRAMDRLTLGIIAAAVIIGSSIVLSAGQSGPIAGYVIPIFGGISVPVMLSSLGFFLALVLAAYVSWGIFRDKDRK